MTTGRNRGKDLGTGLFGVVATGLLFFFPILFLGTSFSVEHENSDWDFKTQYQPFALEYTDRVQSGDIPEWSSRTLNGFPTASSGLMSPFYPVRLIFAGLFPFSWFYDLFIVFHVLLGGVLSFVFLRSLKLSPLGAWAGATVWMLNGFSVSWMQLHCFCAVTAWLPLVALCVAPVVGERPFYLFVGATALAMLSLGSVLWAAQYAYMLAGLYGLLLLLQSSRSWRSCLRPALNLGGMFLLSFAIGAVLFLPVFELMATSHRSPMPYKLALRGCASLADLSRLLEPAIGVPLRLDPNRSMFVGISGLLFGGASLFTKKRTAHIFLQLFVVFMLLAFGSRLLALAYFLIPGVDLASANARFLSVGLFCGSVLIAYGVDHIRAGLLKQMPKWVPIAILGCVSTWGLIQILFWGAETSGWLVLHFFLVGTVVGGAALNRHRWTVPALVLLLGVELFSLGYFHHLSRLGKRPADIRPPMSEKLKAPLSNPNFRQAAIDLYPAQSFLKLPGNWVEGYQSLAPRWLSNFTTSLDWRRITPGPIARSYSYEVGNLDSPVLRESSVRWLITGARLARSDVRLHAREAFGRIYERREVPPRAAVHFSWENVASFREAHQRMESRAGSVPSLLVEGPAARQSGRSPVPAEILRDTGDLLVVRTPQLEEPGMLVVRDTWYPGWQAVTERKTREIHRINGTFRGILLPPGKHVVTLTYNSIALRYGLLVSLFTVVLALLGGAFFYFYRRKNSDLRDSEISGWRPFLIVWAGIGAALLGGAILSKVIKYRQDYRFRDTIEKFSRIEVAGVTADDEVTRSLLVVPFVFDPQQTKTVKLVIRLADHDPVRFVFDSNRVAVGPRLLFDSLLYVPLRAGAGALVVPCERPCNVRFYSLRQSSLLSEELGVAPDLRPTADERAWIRVVSSMKQKEALLHSDGFVWVNRVIYARWPKVNDDDIRFFPFP